MAFLHPMPCEFIHTVATIPSVRNSDRCTFHTHPHPSCSYLICLPRGLQNPNPIYATCICYNIVFFLPVLSKLYLLFSCRNRCVGSLFFTSSCLNLFGQYTRCVVSSRFRRCRTLKTTQGYNPQRFPVSFTGPTPANRPLTWPQPTTHRIRRFVCHGAFCTGCPGPER
jgi:hypothetical protein